MERDTCVHVPWFIQTHTWVTAHAVLSVWICLLVYMGITMCMCVCVFVSVSHIYTLTQIHHIQCTYTTRMQKKTRVHVPQFIHTRAWAVTHVVCLYGCVYVCMCVSQTCVYEYVYTYLYHTSSHWHGHAYTQYTWTSYIQRDTYVNVPWFIQTHAWVAAHVVLSV